MMFAAGLILGLGLGMVIAYPAWAKERNTVCDYEEKYGPLDAAPQTQEKK